MKYNRRRAGSSWKPDGKDYLRFTALEDCEFWFNGTSNTNVLCSVDEGHHWQQANVITSVSAGESVIWKQSSDYVPTDKTSIGLFHSTGAFNISGCIASLIDGDGDFENIETVPYDNLFENLFSNTPVVSANDLSLIFNPSEGCYIGMFHDCTNLTNMPMFWPGNTATDCYASMFEGCVNLTQNVYIYCDNAAIADGCYISMFQRCESITNVVISCPISGEGSFANMFEDCTSLQTAQVTINNVASYCCQSMFQGCTSLTSVTPLIAETLVEGCYYDMFKGCTGLTVSPMIKAKHLPSANKSMCCRDMFNGCSSLSTIYCFAEDNIDTDNFYSWVNGVAATGTFYKPDIVTWPTGVNGIPTGWQTDGNMFNYLTFTALEDTTFTFSYYKIQYSLDDGMTWTELSAGGTTPTVLTGNKILWKRNSTQSDSTHGTGIFSSSGTFEASGNIMSIINGDNFIESNRASGYQFYRLFEECSTLVNAEHLILPATTVGEYCYSSMFERCTSLLTAPELPAKALSGYCYDKMFFVCSSLNYIKCLATSLSGNRCLTAWVSGVSNTGTFVKDATSTIWTTGTSGIPSGWTVQDA